MIEEERGYKTNTNFPNVPDVRLLLIGNLKRHVLPLESFDRSLADHHLAISRYRKPKGFAGNPIG